LLCGGKTRTAAKIWLALAELLPDEGTTPAVSVVVLDADGSDAPISLAID